MSNLPGVIRQCSQLSFSSAATRGIVEISFLLVKLLGPLKTRLGLCISQVEVTAGLSRLFPTLSGSRPLLALVVFSCRNWHTVKEFDWPVEFVLSQDLTCGPSE